MTGDDAQVRLPPDLRTQCEARIEGTDFESVEEYVQFVMAALLEGDEDQTEIDSRTGSDDVTDRLKSLGYL